MEKLYHNVALGTSNYYSINTKKKTKKQRKCSTVNNSTNTQTVYQAFYRYHPEKQSITALFMDEK